MRRRYKVILLAAAMTVLTAATAFLLTECSEQLSVAPALRGDAERNAEETDGADPEAAQVTAIAEISKETEPWRKAYAEILRRSEAEMFSFCRVDADEVPELVLHMSKEFTHDNGDVSLYTYYNSTAVLLGDKFCCDGYSNFLYQPGSGYVISGFFHEDYGAFEIFLLEDGTIQSQHTFDEYLRDDPVYHIDDQSFPVWTYRSRFYQYTKNSVNDYGEYDLTEENIRKTLEA